MLEAVRNIPGRWWNNDEKLWLLPHNQTVVNQLLKNLYTTGLFNAEEKEERHLCSDTTMQTGKKYIASQIRKVSASTQNQALAALLFYFRFVQQKTWQMDGEPLQCQKPWNENIPPATKNSNGNGSSPKKTAGKIIAPD